MYALGVIWYQLLKGDLASPAPTGRRWMDVLRSRGMSDAAIDLLSSCFESDPAYRPADAGMLAEQLQALAPSASKKAAGPITEFLPVDDAPPSAPKPSAPSPPKPLGAGPPQPAARTLKQPPEPHLGQAGLSKASASSRSSATNRSRRSVGRLRLQARQAVMRSAGETRDRKRWALIAAGVLGAFVCLGVILYIATDNGTIKIKGTDSSMKVQIDGQEVRIENLGKPITIRAGQHKLAVTRDGLEVKTDSVPASGAARRRS